MSASLAAVSPAAACGNPIGARPAAEEPALDFASRRLPVSRGAAGRSSVKRSRREMAPQRIEKVESAPGNGAAPLLPERQSPVQGRVAIPVWQHSLCLSPRCRGDAGRTEIALQSVGVCESALENGMARPAPERRSRARGSAFIPKHSGRLSPDSRGARRAPLPGGAAEGRREKAPQGLVIIESAPEISMARPAPEHRIRARVSAFTPEPFRSSLAG